MDGNYPKMLYKGDSGNFQHVIAQNSEHEQQLKAQGWQEHAELKEPDPAKSNGVDIGITDQSEFKYAGVSQVEYDEVANERDAALAKVSELEAALDYANRENAAYRKQIRFKEVEDMSADDIRKILDERKVPYGARDGKPALVNLVLESD